MRTKRFASWLEVAAPLVPTITVAEGLTKEAYFGSLEQPERHVTMPVDEMARAPEVETVVPSLFVQDPVNVPSDLTTSLSVSQDAVGLDERRPPCQAPARSASEIDAGCRDNTIRPDDPSDNVAVQVMMELFESVMQREVADCPLRLISIPLDET